MFPLALTFLDGVLAVLVTQALLLATAISVMLVRLRRQRRRKRADQAPPPINWHDEGWLRDIQGADFPLKDLPAICAEGLNHGFTLNDLRAEGLPTSEDYDQPIKCAVWRRDTQECDRLN